jgi:tyrosinase
MSTVSRRSFIAGASTVPFAVWFEKNCMAQPPRVRPNVMSTQGQAMLDVYANAVQIMMSTPEADPRGWLFQWYTHGVRGDRTKAGEVTRIYPTPSARRTLANAAWETCQAHHPGDVEDYFLPWHRMYLFYFERIIQKITNNQDFALPYWDYTNFSSPSGPRLPERFRNPANASNPLFRPNRIAAVNAGNPIANQSILNLDALRECRYSRVGASQGFNLNLDANLHGNVHVRVGNNLGMGRIPWAANDPIFYLHHCNIDRLWASWNAATGPGHQNPNTAVWLNKTFTFADENGVRVVGRVRDFRNIQPLRYRYEELAPVPPPPCPPGTQAAGPPQVRARLAAALELTAAPTKARLTRPATAAAGLQDLAERVRNLGPNRRLFLVIRRLNARAAPGTVFDVFLELPAGTSGEAAEANRIGTIHFFDAVPEHGHGSPAAANPDKFFSFDITDLAKRLAQEGRLTSTPELTIVPADQPEANSRPVVGEITLVEQ